MASLWAGPGMDIVWRGSDGVAIGMTARHGIENIQGASRSKGTLSVVSIPHGRVPPSQASKNP